MSELTNYMNPNAENDRYLEEHKDEVLFLLMKKGVSYPSEISRETGIHMDCINKILGMFARFGFIKKVVPDRFYPQQIFKSRIPEFWAMGLIGYERLVYMSWFTPTIAGIEYIKAKYKGEQKQIRLSLINYLGYKIQEVTDEQENKD